MSLAMEHRINILSKTSPSAITALSSSYRRPRVSFEGIPYEPLSSSCTTLASSSYQLRRIPRSVSTPPAPRLCADTTPAPRKSSLSSRAPSSSSKSSSSAGKKSSDSKNSKIQQNHQKFVVVDENAEFVQVIHPVGLIDNVPNMDLAMFTQLAEITDCLYLSAAAAVRLDRLRPRMITHIINCTLDIPNFKADGIESVNIQVDDSTRAHLGIHFDRCADMIREVSHKGGRVLIHCVAGISRSASLCIAYLMKYERMTLEHAYRHVKRIRPVIHPNVGFWRQLIEYEKRVFGTTTVKMVNSNMGLIPDVYAEQAKDFVPLPRHSRYR